jgi:rhodanese-related sulfurtransferase
MYRGDVTPDEAYEKLMKIPGAVLIDVRTGPEWAFVGVPAVEGLLRISWQDYPQMKVNERFAEMVEQAGVPKDAEVMLICRSGARSAAAAAALTAAGYENAWNVAQGFEGDRDAEGHRGTVGGWKAVGLPWVQS